MKFDLAIETSTQIGSIALSDGESLLAETVLGAHTRHAEALLPALEEMLKSSEATTEDIARVAVGGGPGSFTGLRIAAASAKGLVHALRVPLYAYSGLLVVAARSEQHVKPVCALFDARRSEVYAACYSIGSTIDTVLPPGVFHIEELLDVVDADHVTFAGEGALKHASIIRKRGGFVLPAEAGTPRASALLSLLDRFPDFGLVNDPAHWEPEYLRESSAERGISA
jgi:tRNA threonylcarbamoyladenosine biosynthesis protein TsaB